MFMHVIPGSVLGYWLSALKLSVIGMVENKLFHNGRGWGSDLIGYISKH